MTDTLDRLRRDAVRRFAQDPERYGYVGDGHTMTDGVAGREVVLEVLNDAAAAGDLPAFGELVQLANRVGWTWRQEVTWDDELTDAEHAALLGSGAVYHAVGGWIENRPHGVRAAVVDLGRVAHEASSLQEAPRPAPRAFSDWRLLVGWLRLFPFRIRISRQQRRD
jgi:hypothetical protein